jgi:hypothetical protein
VLSGNVLAQLNPGINRWAWGRTMGNGAAKLSARRAHSGSDPQYGRPARSLRSSPRPATGRHFRRSTSVEESPGARTRAHGRAPYPRAVAGWRASAKAGEGRFVRPGLVRLGEHGTHQIVEPAPSLVQAGSRYRGKACLSAQSRLPSPMATGGVQSPSGGRFIGSAVRSVRRSHIGRRRMSRLPSGFVTWCLADAAPSDPLAQIRPPVHRPVLYAYALSVGWSGVYSV